MKWTLFLLTRFFTFKLKKLIFVFLILFEVDVASSNTFYCLHSDLDVKDRLSINSQPELQWYKSSNTRIGANVLYWIDDDNAWKSGPLSKKIKEMGIKTLRFPAGEVADNYDWERHRLERSDEWPGEALSDTERMARTDYLEFLSYAKELDIRDLFFVVNVDGAFRSPGNLEHNLQKYAEKAARWVRAVSAAGYRVQYWEIGNEPYLVDSPLTAKEYAHALRIFSKFMRAADPSILIGAAGPSGPKGVGFADQLTFEQLEYVRSQKDGIKDICKGYKINKCLEIIRSNVKGEKKPSIWWETLLQEAPESFDFAVIHRYEQLDLKDSSLKTGEDRFVTVPKRLRELLQQRKGQRVLLALTEWNTPNALRNQPLNETEHLFNIAIQLANNFVAEIDFTHYWPLRFSSKAFKPLLTMDGLEHTVTSRLFAIMSEMVNDSYVAQTIPKEGIYILRSQKPEFESMLIVNTTQSEIHLDVQKIEEKRASVSVLRMLGSKTGEVKILDECKENIGANEVFQLSVPPLSLIVANARYQ